MGRADYAFCRNCGRSREEAGELSHTRLCIECSTAILTDNIVGLATMSGKPLERWRRGMVACVGGVLLDDPRRNA